MRRAISLISALCLVAVIPASVQAGRAVRGQEHTLEFSCETASPDVTAWTNGFLNANGDGFMELFVWVAPANPAVDFPSALSDSSVPPVFTLDGSDAVVQVSLRDADGGPAGMATIATDLLPVGDPIPVDERAREGNHWFTAEGTAQTVEGTADITLPNLPPIEVTCGGMTRDVTIFQTEPTSWIRQFDRIQMECDLSGPGDQHLYLGVDASPEDGFGFIFGNVATTGNAMASVGGEGTLSGDTFAAEVAITDMFSGEPIGAGSIDVSLTPTGDGFRETLPYTNGPIVVTGQYLAVDGVFTATIGDGPQIEWDLVDCVAANVHIKDMLHAPKGPQPKGRPAANDLPTGAGSVAVGETVRQSTRTASPTAEASTMDCLGVDMFNTVWFRITALSDGPITISTDNSDFDTMLAVYADDGSLEPIPGACNDDQPFPPLGRLIQAELTFEAEAGETYLVQAGSFPTTLQPYGRLVLSVR